jgi:hypothetical protein
LFGAFENDEQAFVGPVADVGDDAEFGAEFADDFDGGAGFRGLDHVDAEQALVQIAHDLVIFANSAAGFVGQRGGGQRGMASRCRITRI